MARLSRFRYIFLAVVVVATLLAKENEVVLAENKVQIIVNAMQETPIRLRTIKTFDKIVRPPIVAKANVKVAIGNDAKSENTFSLLSLLPIRSAVTYLPVPSEDYNPIEWIDPWQTKERRTVSYLPIIEAVLVDGDFPNVSAMLVMGMIAQETGGDPNAECNDFDTARGTCAVGLMAVSPSQCGVTEEQLKNSTININCGTRIINTVIEQAIEKGFRPGRDATRAALGAYNCSWPSLLADRCYSFGGWMYSDKINNYWIPLLEKYLEELE